jgi:hypothetical protein
MRLFALNYYVDHVQNPVGATLSKKIASEKRELEERLAKLNRGLIGKSAIKRGHC